LLNISDVHNMINTFIMYL